MLVHRVASAGGALLVLEGYSKAKKLFRLERGAWTHVLADATNVDLVAATPLGFALAVTLPDKLWMTKDAGRTWGPETTTVKDIRTLEPHGTEIELCGPARAARDSDDAPVPDCQRFGTKGDAPADALMRAYVRWMPPAGVRQRDGQEWRREEGLLPIPGYPPGDAAVRAVHACGNLTTAALGRDGDRVVAACGDATHAFLTKVSGDGGRTWAEATRDDRATGFELGHVAFAPEAILVTRTCAQYGDKATCAAEGAIRLWQDGGNWKHDFVRSSNGEPLRAVLPDRRAKRSFWLIPGDAAHRTSKPALMHVDDDGKVTEHSIGLGTGDPGGPYTIYGAHLDDLGAPALLVANGAESTTYVRFALDGTVRSQRALKDADGRETFMPHSVGAFGDRVVTVGRAHALQLSEDGGATFRKFSVAAFEQVLGRIGSDSANWTVVCGTEGCDLGPVLWRWGAGELSATLEGGAKLTAP